MICDLLLLILWTAATTSVVTVRESFFVAAFLEHPAKPSTTIAKNATISDALRPREETPWIG